MTSDWMIAKHHNQPAAGDMLYLFTVFPPAQAQISFLNPPTKRGCDKMVNHFVAASFLRLYFIIFSSAVSLLRKNARKPPYPHKTFNYIVLGGNPYTHYFCDVFP